MTRTTTKITDAINFARTAANWRDRAAVVDLAAEDAAGLDADNIELERTRRQVSDELDRQAQRAVEGG